MSVQSPNIAGDYRRDELQDGCERCSVRDAFTNLSDEPGSGTPERELGCGNAMGAKLVLQPVHVCTVDERCGIGIMPQRDDEESPLVPGASDAGLVRSRAIVLLPSAALDNYLKPLRR